MGYFEWIEVIFFIFSKLEFKVAHYLGFPVLSGKFVLDADQRAKAPLLAKDARNGAPAPVSIFMLCI